MTAETSVRVNPRSFGAGRYVVRRRLGAGGQKTVYLVHDTALDRECALAQLVSDGAGEQFRGLKIEAQTLARMGAHPNIVTVYDIGEENGQSYVVSEHVAGGDLAQELERSGGVLPIARAIDVARDILKGLIAVHGRGVVHRDLKPGNVWIDETGRAKLGDFGLALTAGAAGMTMPGVVTGTPAYVAPEQLHNEPVDARADLYALGCLLFELLTGRPPFVGPVVALISQHLHATPAPPSRINTEVSAELDAFVLDLLRKRPSERPADAREALKALNRVTLRREPSGEVVVPEDARLIVGRRRELAEVIAGLESARSGHGRLFLFSGEPGIGKSHLAEENAVEASRRGFAVVWGRAWEAGGAPSYWPWMEMLRSIADRAPQDQLRAHLGAAAADLAQLLPEIATRLQVTPSASLNPDADRFRLFDAIAGFLNRTAAAQPLLLILEDVHAADSPSLLLLAFVAQRLKQSRVVIVATYRDVEARLSRETSELLAKVSRDARSLPLKRLDRSEVAELLERTRAGAKALAERVYEATEGNPLFVSEVLRLVEMDALDGHQPAERVQIPEGVRATIRERLARVPPEARPLLELGAAVGRTFVVPIIASVSGKAPAEARKLLAEGVRLGVISEPSSGKYAFSHVLVRDVLHDDMEESERCRAHAAIAEALERLHAGDAEAPLVEIAHHLLRAGPDSAERAVELLVLASRRALQRLAPEEAVSLLERALATLEEHAPSDVKRRAEVLIELGTAAIRAGDPDRGEKVCVTAAEIGRRSGSADIIARAALSYGSRFVVARIDKTMISLLEEALEKLPESEVKLRARVLARLGAALQPAADPYEPIAMVKRAVVIARESHDKPTLLAALFAAGSAMAYFAQPDDRRAVDQETLELALELGEKAIALRGYVRLIWDLADLADMTALDSAARAFATLAAEFRQPQVDYMPLLLRAARARIEGRFEEADAALESAKQVVERSGERGVTNLIHVHEFCAARLKDDRVAMQAAAADVFAATVWTDPSFLGTIAAALAAALGDMEKARAELDALELRRVPMLGAGNTFVAEACLATKNVATAQRLYDRLRPAAGQLSTWGQSGWFIEGPLERAHLLAAMTLERWDDVDRHYQSAHALAAKLNQRPALALLELDYARSLIDRPSADPTRARALCESAKRRAAELGMIDTPGRADALLERIARGALT